MVLICNQLVNQIVFYYFCSKVHSSKMPVTCHVTYKTIKRIVTGETPAELASNIRNDFDIVEFALQIFDNEWDDWVNIRETDIADRQKLRVVQVQEHDGALKSGEAKIGAGHSSGASTSAGTLTDGASTTPVHTWASTTSVTSSEEASTASRKSTEEASAYTASGASTGEESKATGTSISHR